MKSKKILFLLIPFVAGMMFLGGTKYVLKKTSSVEFCSSCHTMDIVFEEWKASSHYTNSKGIRAECSDCHIPQDTFGYIKAKLIAGKDIYHQFVSKKIDTPEKFEEHRGELAKGVWAQMRKNDSAPCRSCHELDSMDIYSQSPLAEEQHALAIENGDKTCIDCHKGVAHFVPYDEESANKAVEVLANKAKETSKDAKKVYPYESIEIFDEDDKVIGKIISTTELVVDKVDGDKRYVSIKGYQQEGAESVIYISSKERILSAVIAKSSVDRLDAGSYERDGNDTNWREVQLSGIIKSDSVLDSPDSLWEYAEELNDVYCGQCHGVIGAPHFTANQWPNIVKGMAERTPMSKSQEEILTQYLQKHVHEKH